MGSATSINTIPDNIDLESFKSLTGVHFRQSIFDEYKNADGVVQKEKLLELMKLFHLVNLPPPMISEESFVPDVTFKVRVRDSSLEGPNPFKFLDVTTADLFKGKRVVLFCLPGAFTPVCSSFQVPGYVEKYDEIRSLGVDEIYCLSVNDAFVMRQWGINLGLELENEDSSSQQCPLNPGNFKKVKLLPDGAALFTEGMGMGCTWTTNRGFGRRSWRYSCVINHLKVEKLFVEAGQVIQNSGPDPFEVSDANTMLAYLQSCNK